MESYRTVEYIISEAPSGTFATMANDFVIGRSIREYGEWSYLEIAMIRQFLRPDSNVLEAGANIGTHTMFLARDICPQGRIFAFEPRRKTYQLLCANMLLNGVSNVYTYQKAVGSKPDVLWEGDVPADLELNLGALRLGAVKGHHSAMHVVTLDSMLDQFPKITLLKADVEGYEQEMLHGAQGLIARDRPFLYLEADRPEASPELIQMVMDMGYRVYWHTPPLFRPTNFAGNPENFLGESVGSFNIFCIPREGPGGFADAREVTDPQYHPMVAAQDAYAKAQGQ